MKKIFSAMILLSFFAAGAGAQEVDMRDDNWVPERATGTFSAPSLTWQEVQANQFAVAKSRNTLPITKEAQDKAQECFAKAKTANTMCLESTNPKIVTAVAAINGLMAGAQMMGLTKACSKYKNVMDMAKLAMTGFSALCGGAKYMCENACKDAAAHVPKAQAEIAQKKAEAAASTPASAVLLQQVADAEYGATHADLLDKAALKECGSYAITLGSAVVGGFQLLQRSSLAKQCETATATAVAVDCTKKENAQMQDCICQRMPNAVGCPGAMALVQSGGTPTTTSAGVESVSAVASSGNPNLNVLPDSGLGAGITSASSAAGGSMGGGGAGGGGAGGGGGGKGADNAKGGAPKSGLNANILSGDNGGGGGGGVGARGSGSGYGSEDKYSRYLPGGSADPSRSPAANRAKLEVTGAGGENNFQKVKERYRDAKPTLIGQ